METFLESRSAISKSRVLSVVILALTVVECVVGLKVVVDVAAVVVVGGTTSVVDVVTHSGLCTSPKSLNVICE